MRRKLEAIVLLEHACVTVSRNAAGLLEGVELTTDHMEKSEIRWWTVQELRQVICNGGYHKDQSFRLYFLPVLSTFLDRIELIMK
jgi:hypothetical protein